MAHPLSEISIRADWREITQRIVRQDTRDWAAMRFAVIGVAVLAQLLTLVLPSWGMALGVGLFCVLFWGFPLRWLWRSSCAHARTVCAGSALAVGVAIVAALVIAPMYIGGIVRPAAWPVGLVIPFVGWCVAAVLVRTFPRSMRALGFTGDAWHANLVIGAAVGAALGFHLLIVVNDSPDLVGVSRSASALAWFISFQLGLRVLGEELFFRGLGFRLLSRVGASDRVLTAWLVLLNLFVYLWLVGQSSSLLAGLPISGPLLSGLLVVYGGLMAFACTRLRLSRGSLLPGLACQAVFMLFVAAVIWR